MSRLTSRFIPAVAARNTAGPVHPDSGDAGLGYECLAAVDTIVFGGGFILPEKFVGGTDVVLKTLYAREGTGTGTGWGLSTHWFIAQESEGYMTHHKLKDEAMGVPVDGYQYFGNEITWGAAADGDIFRPYTARYADSVPGDDLTCSIFILGFVIDYYEEY